MKKIIQGGTFGKFGIRVMSHEDCELSARYLSRKDWQDYDSVVLEAQGRIGFRTPSFEETMYRDIVGLFGESLDHEVSEFKGYRKHAFVLRQIGVIEFYEARRNADKIDWHIAQNYID